MKQPKFVVYDNAGETLDRYTIIDLNRPTIEKKNSRKLYECICASENGLGVYMWGECLRGSHLGKKVPFESIPTDLQEMIKKSFTE